jgi:coproporphyrinogen III oxidase
VPLTARWEYQPDVGTLEGSREKVLMEVLKNPVEWV